MKVHTKVVLEWKDGKYQRIESECESFDYEGPVSECKGGGGNTTVEKSNPWGGSVPYLTHSGINSSVVGIYPESARLYREYTPQYFEGDTISPQSAETLQSQQMTGDIATQGSQGNTNLQNLYSQTMGGDFLYGGQGFDRAFQAASNRIIPQVDSRFALAGRSGSGLAQTAQTQALGDAFAGLYNDERGRQMQMAAMAPQINQMRYADANALATLGAQKEDYQQDLINAEIERHNYEQNIPYDKLDRYAALVQPGAMVGGSRAVTSPVSRNRAAGVTGGALSGAILASMLGGAGGAAGGAAAGASAGSIVPGWGTLIGAGLGGLLGAM